MNRIQNAMPSDFSDSQSSGPISAAVYTRYSCDLQRPTSTEDQIRECRDAAEGKGWTVLGGFIRSDEATSGQPLAGRDGLDELIKLAEQPNCPFDGILIDDTSRIGRNLSDTLPLSDRLKFANVFLYFVNRRLDSRDPSFRTLFIAYGHQDEMYSAGVGEKVHRGQKGQVLAGHVGSGRAYGYRNVPIESATRKGQWGRPFVEAVEFQKIPEEVEVVIRIFKLYVGGLGHRAIARRLNDDEVPSPFQGRSPIRRVRNATNIKGILRNEKYRGVNVWNRTRAVRNPTSRRKEQRRRPESEWVRVEVPEWRIVSEELWNAAVEANKSRQGPSWWKEGGLNRSAASRRYLFSGLLNCPECGGNFNIVSGKVSAIRYGCVGHRYRGTCRNKLTILRRLLEPQLLQAISGSLLDPAVRERLSRDYHHQVLAASEETTLTAQRVASTAEDLQERKVELRRKADNLLDSIQDLGRSPLLSERMKSVDAEMRSIDLLLATQTEVAIEPLTAEAIRELLDRKLTDLEAVLMGDPEVAKQQIRKHIAKLALTPVDTDGGPRYEVSGDVSVFARGDADDVLLASSLQRTSKQYTSLSFPFKATLNPRAELRRKRSGVDGRYMTLD